MKTILKSLLVLVIIGALALGVMFIVFKKDFKPGEARLISVKVEKTTITTTISATGTLEPVEQVEVGTQVSGDISKIYVDFNSNVKKGQVIAELDKSKLKATLTQAELALKSAQNDYEFKKLSYDRTKKLAENKSASQVDLQTAEYNMTAAKLSVTQRQNEVAQAKLNLGYATIKSPINGVILKRAVDVGQTVAASMSAPTLFIIAKDLSQMKVMAAVDEADIGQVKPGQKVEFTVDAFQNDKFQGKVQEVRLSPTTTSNVVTYTVVISAENPELKLLPGMTATCTIVTQELSDVVAIPVKALKFRPDESTPMAEPRGPRPSGMPPSDGKMPSGKFGPADGKGAGSFGPPNFDGKGNFGPGSGKKKAHPKGDLVWIDQFGKAAPRHVKTGISDGINIEILQGLSEGDAVVVGQETEAQGESPKSDARSPFMPGPPKGAKKFKK